MVVIMSVAMTSMCVIVSMRVSMGSAGIPRNARCVKYVRQAGKYDMIQLWRSLPSGKGSDKQSTKMQPSILMAAQGCRQRKENKRRR